MGGQQTSIGCLGRGWIVRPFSQVGRKQNIFRGLGRYLQRGEKLIACHSRIALLIDAGKRSPGASLEAWFGGGGQRGSCNEFSTCLSKLAGAGEHQTKRKVRLQEGSIIGNRVTVT